MKTAEIAVLAAAGVAVYLILKTAKGGSAPAWVREVFSQGGTPYANGWRYYDNGVAISPAGEYFHGGQKVWSPT